MGGGEGGTAADQESRTTEAGEKKQGVIRIVRGRTEGSASTASAGSSGGKGERIYAPIDFYGDIQLSPTSLLSPANTGSEPPEAILLDGSSGPVASSWLVLIDRCSLVASSMDSTTTYIVASDLETPITVEEWASSRAAMTENGKRAVQLLVSWVKSGIIKTNVVAYLGDSGAIYDEGGGQCVMLLPDLVARCPCHSAAFDNAIRNWRTVMAYPDVEDTMTVRGGDDAVGDLLRSVVRAPDYWRSRFRQSPMVLIYDQCRVRTLDPSSR
jgi:hypothetical protein